MKNRKQRFGFTLAEVLITIGVIGVVAAMTIPTLMANYQKRETAIRVKKTYAVLLQAIKLSEVQNDDFESWDFPSAASKEATKTAMNKYILPYMSGVSECDRTTRNCGKGVSKVNGMSYTLNNGVSFGVSLSRVNERNRLYIMINPQYNAKKVSSDYRLGRDSFYFDTDNEKNKLLPHGYMPNLTRDQIKQGYNLGSSQYSCKKSADSDNDSYYRYGCTMLLMLDNWEFKNDYPW